MKITLYDSETSLPDSMDEHILVYTGIDLAPEQEDPGIVTEVRCTYAIGDKTVVFRKNTESIHLRFEDAVLWAIRYANTFEIPDVHAVFKLERPIDPRFLRKISAIQFIDKRRFVEHDNTGNPIQFLADSAPSSRKRPLPKSVLQRHPALRGKLNRFRDFHSNRRTSSLT
ncbi:MAG: hypothetical protein GKS00_09575 [Alphaproteobacteria bacterium]|nr:hypothetical protein [Alphaproteobacteria bacterium]